MSMWRNLYVIFIREFSIIFVLQFYPYKGILHVAVLKLESSVYMRTNTFVRASKLVMSLSIDSINAIMTYWHNYRAAGWVFLLRKC